MNTSKYYEIGTVLRSVGLQGKIKISFKQKYKELSKGEALFFSLDNQMIPYFIEEIRWETELVATVLFEDLNQKEAADKLVKKNIFVDKIFKEVKEKQNQNFDFLNFTVLNFENKNIGEIIGFIDMGEYFLIDVKSPNKTYMLPLHADLIIDHDFKQKWISIKISDGLLDL